MTLKLNATENITIKTTYGRDNAPVIESVTYYDSADFTTEVLSGKTSGNSYLKITGHNFTEDTKLYVNQTEITTKYLVTDNEMRARIYPDLDTATVVDLYVENPSGEIGLWPEGHKVSSAPEWVLPNVTVSLINVGDLVTGNLRTPNLQGYLTGIDSNLYMNANVNVAVADGNVLITTDTEHTALNIKVVDGFTGTLENVATLSVSDAEGQESTLLPISIELSSGFTDVGDPGLVTLVGDNKTALHDAGSAEVDWRYGGIPTASAKNPFTGPKSLYWTSGQSGLQINGPELANFGTADFTAECWFYAINLGWRGVFEWRTSPYADTYQGPAIVVTPYSTIELYSQGEQSSNEGGTVYANTWHHVALVRQSGTGRVYLDGTQIISTTLSSNVNQVRTLLGTSDGGDTMNGYISNFRVTPGEALYPNGTAFKPKKIQWTTENSPNATIIINNDLVNEANVLTPITRYEQLDTRAAATPQQGGGLETVASTKAEEKYGSAYFNGYTSLTSQTSAIESILGTSSLTDQTTLTIQTWVYQTQRSGATPYLCGDMDVNGSTAWWTFGLDNIGRVKLYSNQKGSVNSDVRIPLNEWHHIACVIDQGDVRLYIDGDEVATWSFEGSMSTTGEFGLGKISSGGTTNGFFGYLHDFRVDKAALYSSDYTLPTSPGEINSLTTISLFRNRYSTTPSTVNDSNNMVNDFVWDESYNSRTLTLNGDPKVTTFGPYSSQGHSMYFDGTGALDFSGDGATANNLGALNSNVTMMEAWIWPEQNDGNSIISANTGSATLGRMNFNTTSDDKLQFQYSYQPASVTSGQQAYTTPGTYTWTAPAGVTSVSVVAIGGGGGGSKGLGYNGVGLCGGGGGGLGWKNNIPVTPGATYEVVVGGGGNWGYGGGQAGGNSYFVGANLVLGERGGGGGQSAGVGGGYVGDGGGFGGQAGAQGGNFRGTGGGGAGGYSGKGGDGIGPGGTGQAGQGGGGGGGAGRSDGQAGSGGGGGGVGILGEGASGAGGVANADTGGKGGSGGADGQAGQAHQGTAVTAAGSGGAYGGGGGGAASNFSTEQARPGAGGAVRIIWGANRSFPSTNTIDQTGTITPDPEMVTHTTSANVSKSEWSHVAVVVNDKTGTDANIHLFVNGNQEIFTSSTLSDNTFVADGVKIGDKFKGYISGLRYIRANTDIAGYISNLSNTTLPIQPPSWVTDTKLLLTGPNFKNQNEFVYTGNKSQPTPTGNVKITNFGPFQSLRLKDTTYRNSVYFDGRRILIPNGDNIYGATSYAMEFWAYPITGTSSLIAGTGSGDYDGRFNPLNQLVVESKLSTSQRIVVNTGLTANNWYHVAIAKNNGYHAVWVNGKRVFYNTNTASYSPSSISYLGAGTGAKWIYNNFRIVQGTDNSTVQVYDPADVEISLPEYPLTNLANTKLLFAQNIDANAWINGNDTANVLSTHSETGNLYTVPFSPFGMEYEYNNFVQAYDSAEHSGSLYFDGTDYISTTVNKAPGTGDFTYETWIYLNDLSTGQGIFNTRSGNTTDGFDLYIENNILIATYTNTALFTGTTQFKKHQWYHICITRLSGQWTAYINGKIEKQFSNASNFTSTTFYLGARALANDKFRGYISNTRIANRCLYMYEFTPDPRPVDGESTGTLLEYDRLSIEDNTTDQLIINPRGQNLNAAGNLPMYFVGATTAVHKETIKVGCFNVGENEDAVLTVPAGYYVSGVRYAQYGVHSGSCGSYTSAANNADATSWATTNFVGQVGPQIVTVTAPSPNGTYIFGGWNVQFGDPLSGTTKRLAAEFTLAQIEPGSDTTRRLGNGGYYLPSGGYIRAVETGYVPYLNFYDGDFTIEWWMYVPSGANYQGLITHKENAGSNGWTIYRDTSNGLTFKAAGSNSLSVSSAPDNDVWQHWVVERYNGTLRWFKNGVLDNSASFSHSIADTSASTIFAVGYDQTNSYTSSGTYIDDLRITRYARYQGQAFATPTRVLQEEILPRTSGNVILDMVGANAIDAAVPAEILLVGGGGGGGQGGGGGGGVVYMPAANLYKGQTYSVEIGQGGTGGTTSSYGTAGGNSYYYGNTAYGGGAGGYPYVVGLTGASGGGGAAQSKLGGANIYGPVQGSSGGSGSATIAGGGGGAGEPGNADGQGYGGDGNAITIAGSTVTYGGGGGAIGYPGGDGGGGGTGGAATDGLGGGGYNYGAGGSGIVIVSWDNTLANATVTGTDFDTTETNGKQIYTFSANGTLTIPLAKSSPLPAYVTSNGSLLGNVSNNTVYSDSLISITNDGAELTYEIVSGELPPGLTLLANGLIVGTHQFDNTPTGQQAYTSAGTYTWTAPAGVTSVSVVAIGGGGGGALGLGYNGVGLCGGGGGGLGWKNNIQITPGATYEVVVGGGGARGYGTGGTGGNSYFIGANLVLGAGGQGGSLSAGAGGIYVGDGGGAGGSSAPQGGNFRGTGGGGAGGYSGKGGDGAGPGGTGQAGLGGGGGGAGARSDGQAGSGGGGGGVGILGEGASGAGGVANADTGGKGGSGGADGQAGQAHQGTAATAAGSGGAYGGGGGGAASNFGTEQSRPGAGGAVRIIWGVNRAYPSTDVQDKAAATEIDYTFVARATDVFGATAGNITVTIKSTAS